jgi:hypothetical protein
MLRRNPQGRHAMRVYFKDVFDLPLRARRDGVVSAVATLDARADRNVFNRRGACFGAD